ncbi:MAG: DUF4249 domain-containing protein [Bacteroidia bacterium]
MKTFVYFFSVILLTGLCSCEDVIQVKLDQGSKLVVVDAFVTDMRMDQRIRLTYSDDFFDGQNPPPVKNATVKLTDLSTNKTFNFLDQGTGDYIYGLALNDTVGFVGHNYKLEVTSNGITYTSLATLKRTTPIDSISEKFEKKNGFSDKEGYSCKLWARDIPGPIEDYYWIKSFKNGVLYNKGSQINTAVDGAYSNGADGFLFIPPIADGITQRGDLFQLGDVCRVEIHSISKETYDFLNQVQTQTTNSGLFATTPENIRTNITTPSGAATKAIGWFNMASVSALDKTIN